MVIIQDTTQTATPETTNTDGVNNMVNSETPDSETFIAGITDMWTEEMVKENTHEREVIYYNKPMDHTFGASKWKLVGKVYMDGVEIHANSYDNILGYIASIRSDAYAGVKTDAAKLKSGKGQTLTEAIGAFNKKGDSILAGTLGTRGNGGLTRVQFIMLQVIRDVHIAFVKKDEMTTADYKALFTTPDQTKQKENLYAAYLEFEEVQQKNIAAEAGRRWDVEKAEAESRLGFTFDLGELDGESPADGNTTEPDEDTSEVPADTESNTS